MSLKDDLEAEKKPVKSRFEAWVDALDTADREALILAATDPELSTQAIVRVIVGQGYRANKDTISVWRRTYGFTR